MRVSAFIAAVSIFKDIENISDENALKGLPLLFEEHAAVWWRGVRGSVSSWKEALETIKTTFAPRRPAYQVYTELFRTTQDANTPTDLFISRNRAQLAELPNPHPETVQIDMIYGLLHPPLRKKIPRESVKTFTELMKCAREVEDLEKEDQGKQRQPLTTHHRRTSGTFVEPYPRYHRRCNICRRPGHAAIECRFRKNNISVSKPTTAETLTASVKSQLRCTATDAENQELYAANARTARRRPHHLRPQHFAR
ncbi:activity-regulated cytoskeleton associated protein 2 [Halictus rubicundus]|uniref:activity-regulated cytoskeleton associated protein 2 n=1 Tax=Halictus rubicundus TaxID=77578 RepID=UPI0040355C87